MSDLDLNEPTYHPLAKYRNHLEFYGYRVKEVENRKIEYSDPFGKPKQAVITQISNHLKSEAE